MCRKLLLFERFRLTEDEAGACSRSGDRTQAGQRHLQQFGSVWHVRSRHLPLTLCYSLAEVLHPIDVKGSSLLKPLLSGLCTLVLSVIKSTYQ